LNNVQYLDCYEKIGALLVAAKYKERSWVMVMIMVHDMTHTNDQKRNNNNNNK